MMDRRAWMPRRWRLAVAAKGQSGAQRMGQQIPIRAIVAAAAIALGLDIANAQQMPTEVELKAAYCIAVTKKQIEGMAHAKVSDAAAQQYISTMLRDEKDRLKKLQRYFTPRIQTLEPIPILAAMNRGEADYTNYNQRMNEVAPNCIIDCQVLNSTGEVQGKAKQCLSRCLEKDELIARVDSCSKLNWLPH